MGELVGTNRSGLGAQGSFERVGPLTFQSEETRGRKKDQGEIRARFCVFVEGKGLVAEVHKGFSFGARVFFSCFPLFTSNDQTVWGSIVPFRRLLNYLLPLC